MQGNEQLAAVEQVKQLQDKLTMQAKNHQTAQEALAIEEKCKRDQLQVTSAAYWPCQLACVPALWLQQAQLEQPDIVIF